MFNSKRKIFLVYKKMHSKYNLENTICKLTIALVALFIMVFIAQPVQADVLLSGQFHAGDNYFFSLTPPDPVTYSQLENENYPIQFKLSEERTLTGVELLNVQDLESDSNLRIFIDGNQIATGGDGQTSISFSDPVTLGAGLHTFSARGSCYSSQGREKNNCEGGKDEDDFDFEAVSFYSSSSEPIINIIERVHLGDYDDDDWYDPTDNYPYYPDMPQGESISYTFSLTESTNEIRLEFYRLRALDTIADIYLDGTDEEDIVGTLDPDSSETYNLSNDPYSLTLNITLDSGSHTITVSAGDLGGGNVDDFSWDELIIDPKGSGGDVNLGDFNAIENDADPVNGNLYTKISGKDFSVDIVHLNTAGNLQNFKGEVDLDLVDATSGDNCGDLQTIAYLGSTYFDNSKRLTVSGLAYSEAIDSARIRITEASSDQPEQGCSQDTFTIRPLYLTLNATDLDWNSPGTERVLEGNNTDTCREVGGSETCHKAGHSFYLQGAALNYNDKLISEGYTSDAYLDWMLHSPSEGVLGNHTLNSVTFIDSDFGPTNATYHEVGLVNINLNDNGTFAAQSQDKSEKDCISGSSSNTKSNGKYGCQTATQQDRTVGRFVPDHFLITNSTAASFCNACFVGAFTYIGQPFYYREAPTIELEAVNAQNDTTRNYDEAFWKFGNQTDDYLVSRNYTDQANASALLEWNKLDNANATDPTDFDGSWKFSLQGNDCYSNSTDGDEFHYQKNGTEDPFSAKADLNLNQTALTDQDGICYEVNGSCSDYTVEDITGANLFYGRAVAENAYGSELLPLKNIGLRTEYYDGSSFETNTNDSCTVYNATEIDWSNATYSKQGNLTADDLGSSGDGTLENGEGSFSIHEQGDPDDGPGETGYVDYRFPVPSWLKFDWNDNGTRGNPPARATFGIYKGSENIIYQQETTWK